MFNSQSFLSRVMGISVVQRQSLISIASQIAITFLGFFSTIYFAHALDASILGSYFLFLTYYGVITMLTDGGLGGAAIKRISEGEEKNPYFSAFFVLRSLIFTIALIGLFIFRNFFIDLNTSGAYFWLLIALIVSIFHGAVICGIAGQGKMGVKAISSFMGDVTRITLQVIAVFLGYSVAGLIGGYIAGLVIGIIIGLRFFDLHFVRFGLKHIKSLSIFSFWLFLTSGGVILYGYSDKLIIGYYLTNADVGVYSIVMQFITIAALTTNAIRGTLWPQVSRWGKIGELRLIEESLSKAFTYSFILVIPILIGGVLLGDKLLYFLYGAEYERGYLTLVIVSFIQIINIFQFFYTSYLSALDHQKEAFKVTAVGAIINLILSVLLIPIIGIAGAAVATLIALFLNALLAQRILSKILTIRIELNSLSKILEVSALMGLLVGVYRLIIPLSNLWLTLLPVILGSILYGILILKFDNSIYNEIKKIAVQMNLPWPHWL